MTTQKPIDWNAPAIPPQEGREYVTRNGDRVTDLQDYDHRNFRGRIGDNYFWWRKDGLYIVDARHGFDLIAEYIPPKPTPQVGEWWITRDGVALYKVTDISHDRIWCGLSCWNLGGGSLTNPEKEYASDLVRRVEVREIEGEGK